MSRNAAASSEGTAKARVVSCEIGDKAFQVVGRCFTELFLGIATSCADGAALEEVLDKESGKTKVITIKLLPSWKRSMAFSNQIGECLVQRPYLLSRPVRSATSRKFPFLVAAVWHLLQVK